MIAELLALTLEASPTKEECVTPCGMRAQGNCAELSALEKDIVHAFSTYADNWTPEQVCGALKGWEVHVHQWTGDDLWCGGDSWSVADSLCVIGYTHDEYNVVEVMDTNWRGGALAHELVHVVDLATYHRAGHCRWAERGVKRALFEVTKRVDPSKPELSCDP